MEIERKFLVPSLPEVNSVIKKKVIQQGYVSTSPVVRIRRSNDDFILTCKGKGLIEREEFELFITEDEYNHLSTKLDYPLIIKTRYLIPHGKYTIELDVFKGHLDGLLVAEVEFPSLDEANAFTPPDWFGEDVSLDARYQNNQLSKLNSLRDL